jgi:PAS domain S-box-containing protein
MSAAVILADTDGRITAWSGDAERLLGHPAGAALGRTLDLIVPPDHREAHWTGFHRAMATAQCRLDRAATNLPVLHADGGVRVLPARFTFLTDGRDVPVGALVVYADPVGGEEAWGPVLPRPEDAA